MVPVILVLAPLSVWLAWRDIEREIEQERAGAPGKEEPDA